MSSREMTIQEYLRACPLCRDHSATYGCVHIGNMNYAIDCPGCGRFRVSTAAIDDLMMRSQGLELLSGWVRERGLLQEPEPVFCSTDCEREGFPDGVRISDIVHSLAPQGLGETLDRSLLNLAILSGVHGRPVKLERHSPSIFFARDSQQMGYCLREMQARGWFSQLDNMTPGTLTLSAEAWKHTGELRGERGGQVQAALVPSLPSYRIEDQPWWGPLPEIQEESEGVALKRELVILIVVAVRVELDAVLRRLHPLPDAQAILRVHSGSQTFYLGRLGVHSVVVTMCEMGAGGRSGSTVATKQAIKTWNPCAVIMPGIAFGAKPGKQHVADVLVGSRVVCYEPQRVGAVGTTYRGPTAEPGITLLDRLRNAIGWQFSLPDGSASRLEIGILLSGEKLIDNDGFKAALMTSFPDAVGGDMEAAGIYAAADSEKVEWIVAKGICDWADGRKRDDHQALAAAASVSVVEHVLSSEEVLSGLSRPGRPKRKTSRFSSLPLGQEELELLRSATGSHGELKWFIRLIEVKGVEYVTTSSRPFDFPDQPERRKRYVDALLVLHDQHYVFHEFGKAYRVLRKGYDRVGLRPPPEAIPNWPKFNMHLIESANLAGALARDCLNPRLADKTRQQMGQLLETCLKGSRLQRDLKFALPVGEAALLQESLVKVREFLQGERSDNELSVMAEPMQVIARCLRSRRR